MKIEKHAQYVAKLRKQDAAAKAVVERVDEAGNIEVLGTVVDRMRDELVPLFKQPWDERAPITDFRTGRRIGKSEYICRVVFRGAWENPRSINPLILPTAKQARYALWPVLLRTQRKHFPDARVNESEMRMYLPEGGIVACGGCEHAEDVVKWFGIPFQEAAIDECGNFKPHLRALYDDALWPGMMDYGGRLTRSGNPGIVLHGPWFEWTGPARKGNTPLYTGDARLNPYIEKMSGKTPLEFFEATLEKNGWVWDRDDITRSTASFVRLYLGEWAQDAGSLVYPYQAYRDGVPWNYAAELPRFTETGDPVTPTLWRFVIGMDIGFVDDTTYVIVASHPALREQYFTHAEGHAQWLDEQKVTRALQLRQRPPAGNLWEREGFEPGPEQYARIVIDPGGGGKNVIETIALGRPGRPGVPAETAKKPEKALGIREMRDAIIAAYMKFLPDAQPLVDEMNVLGWDDDKLQHDPNGVDHYCDGGLYAKRASAHYSFRPDMGRPPPQPGTNEWFAAERQKFVQQFAARGRDAGFNRFNRRGRYGKVLLQ